MDSSRNTVQFLNETDWNCECQLRKSLVKNINQALDCMANATEKNTCISISYGMVTIQYALLSGNCFNFLLW